MDFHIEIDSSFLEIWGETEVKPAENKRLLTVLNDFEDGAWRTKKFQHFIWDNIAETALSLRERTAIGSQPSSILSRAAQNLRLTDAQNEIGKGSELAEVVLYGIMKHKYGALPVVPKIFYKQNSQDNAKGADSVHIVVDAHGDFSLWFGEAKFYNSLDDARLGEVVRSVKAALATDKLRKENAIVTSVSDLDDLEIPESVKGKIRDALSHKTSIDELKSKIHVPILLLHECQITASATDFSAEYIAAATAFHKTRAQAYFSKQVDLRTEIHKYSEIGFHLILFPVPKKRAIVDTFVADVKFHKG
jgi:hypothetical protein